MKLTIRNMVCDRCIMVVRNIFEKHGFRPQSVSMGEVVFEPDSIAASKLQVIDKDLIQMGFERIDNKKTKIIEKLKNVIVEKIHHSDLAQVKYNWSVFLSEELKYDYNYLTSLFSSVEGITLEQYIIKQKVEKVKELLFYDELNMSEIADKLGYSSVQHLSSQFKKITGATPSEFKKTHPIEHSRKSIDSIS